MIPAANDLTNREERITRRVRQARIDRGLTLKMVGEQLGLSEVGYGHYERGARPFGVEHLFRLSRVLGRSVEHFLGLDTGLTEEEDELLTLYQQSTEAGRHAILSVARTMAQEARRDG